MTFKTGRSTLKYSWAREAVISSMRFAVGNKSGYQEIIVSLNCGDTPHPREATMRRACRSARQN